MAYLISKDLTITIDGNTASLNEDLYIYQGDRNISINFTVADSKFVFSEYDEANILANSTAKYSMIRVIKADGVTRHTVPRTPIQDDKVIFEIDEEFANAVDEIGTYRLQISLYDEGNGRVTIPPITFEVLAPIYDDEEE